MSRDDPFNDNPFAVGSTVQDTPDSGNAWGTNQGGANAWGTSPADVPSSGIASIPSTLPPAMGFGGTSSSFSPPLDTRDQGGSKEKDLDRREAELNRREAELKRLETELRNNGVVLNKRKNWPKWCSVVHHDIKEDIPENLQWTVRSAYFAYCGLLICLIWNFVACCGAWITNGKISSFLWGALYMVGGIPGGWYLWYGRLYKATIRDSAFGYGLFFLFFTTAHLIFTAWSAIAPPIINSWSHAGFWVGAQEVQGESSALAILYYIGGGFWSAEFLWSFWTLKKVYWAFRGAGHSAKDVKRDAARGAVSSAV